MGLLTKASTILGVPPELLAYALAKFSRSKATPETSFLAWLYSVPPNRPEKFFEEIFHNYGHASVADLAHAPLSLESISIVAAIVALHHRLLDCQERSTRYMDFSEAAFATPPELENHAELKRRYVAQCESLFALYRRLHADFVRFLSQKYADRKEEVETKRAGSFEATIKARAFDLARYVLPASTLTGVGMMASARTYMALISAWSSHPLAEIREMGRRAKEALTILPADDYALKAVVKYLEELNLPNLPWEVRKALDELLEQGGFVLPTLMKHVGENKFIIDARACARTFTEKYLTLPPQFRNEEDSVYGNPVQLIPQSKTLDQIVSSILFPEAFGLRLGNVLSLVEKINDEDKREFLKEIQSLRGDHDPVHEGWAGVGALTFDVLVDNGAFRDLHRHRENRQFLQAPTGAFGCAIPSDFTEAGVDAIMREAFDHSRTLALDMVEVGLPVEIMQYALPLAVNIPWVAVMDPRQMGYLTELRTKSAGHFSYREIAWLMHQAVKKEHPFLVDGSRATPFEDFDLFSR